MNRAIRAAWGAFAAAVLLGACAQQPVGERRADAAATLPVPTDAPTLRQRMRELAKVHCGMCHQASLPTAKPAAVAIHNLDAPDWPATLSAAQLEGGFSRRLNARLNQREKPLLRAFVAAEVAQRSR